MHSPGRSHGLIFYASPYRAFVGILLDSRDMEMGARETQSIRDLVSFLQEILPRTSGVSLVAVLCDATAKVWKLPPACCWDMTLFPAGQGRIRGAECWYNLGDGVVYTLRAPTAAIWESPNP